MKATKKQIAEIKSEARKAGFSEEKAIRTLELCSKSIYESIGPRGVVEASMKADSLNIKTIKTMSKYITEFQQTGNSTVNVDLICKDWNDRFTISTWINDKEEKYTFVVNGKSKNTRLCKTQISKEQATEIVSKLALIHVKDNTFRSGGAYHSKNFIKSEVERITKIKQEKEQELSFINQALYMYERCLCGGY